MIYWTVFITASLEGVTEAESLGRRIGAPVAPRDGCGRGGRFGFRSKAGTPKNADDAPLQ
jgi:hypothetical protein